MRQAQPRLANSRWWNPQTRVKLSRSVGPPSCHGMTWWACVQAGGRSHGREGASAIAGGQSQTLSR